jgi:hypothetical protein
MEFIVKDMPDDVYKLLKLISIKDGKPKNQVLIDAIKYYYQEREMAYRKSMQNFDQDKGYQEEDQ